MFSKPPKPKPPPDPVAILVKSAFQNAIASFKRKLEAEAVVEKLARTKELGRLRVQKHRAKERQQQAELQAEIHDIEQANELTAPASEQQVEPDICIPSCACWRCSWWMW
jgi:hypothetical protein